MVVAVVVVTLGGDGWKVMGERVWEPVRKQIIKRGARMVIETPMMVIPEMVVNTRMRMVEVMVVLEVVMIDVLEVEVVIRIVT